ncbi:replication-relaxation family protein [Streptomyces lancefieldiae]|uniref:Replication-relaxation family protein n=1 Tax=Streptomyces lancefieldiae TaxID=3075520 RepID=A0ABU3B1S2_9ACTN|nr:replication-relaxation family protein [Streptomyces sp. DSM 40712]MDT0616199.1 replication-relaxation family protein [Streptomyces sp. DSM 40712]
MSTQPEPELLHSPQRTLSFHAVAKSALDLLYQHRLMTTDQLARLLTPTAHSASYLRRQLVALEEGGLVQRLRAQGKASPGHGFNRPYVWFLTETGADAVEQAAEIFSRRYRVTPESAASTRQAHTLAVNEVGIAFVEHARRLGHDCTPLSWTPEVAHRIRDGQRRFEDDHVISDAVLHYVHVHRGARTMLNVFIELDRATMTAAELAKKVSAYGRLYEFVPQHPDRARRSAASTRPAWQHTYPAFPRLLIVLDGAPGPTLAKRLADRTEDLYTLTRVDPRLSRLASNLSVGVTTLAQLKEHGPFGRIFTPLLRGTPEQRHPLTDMLLRRPAAAAPARHPPAPAPR